MLSSLNKSQKEKVQSFVNFVGSSEKEAQKKLKSTNWDLDQAVEEYLTENGASMAQQHKVDKAKLNDLYARYKDKQEDRILLEGVELLCNDLALDPMDPVMLVLAQALHAERPCEFSRQEFVEGMTALGVDSGERLKAILPSLRARLSDAQQLREVYLFAFNYNKEPQQKSLPLDIAVPVWNLLLPPVFPNLSLWCQFVQEKHGKAISKDTWNLLYDFVTSVNPDLSNYDEDGAWPILIDEFVNYLRELKK